MWSDDDRSFNLVAERSNKGSVWMGTWRMRTGILWLLLPQRVCTFLPWSLRLWNLQFQKVMQKLFAEVKSSDITQHWFTLCVCDCVGGWHCYGDAVTQVVSPPEWKQRWPTASFPTHTHTHSTVTAGCDNLFIKHTPHTHCLCVCVCGMCWLYLKLV